MEARRFDGFSKAWSAGTSRRRVLKGLPAMALGGLLPLSARADAGSVVTPDTAPTGTTGTTAAVGTTGVASTTGTTTGTAGATGATGTSAAVGSSGATETTVGISAPAPVNTGEVPNAGIAAQITPSQVLPARIYAGTCGQLGTEAAFQLIDVGAPGAQGTATPETPTPVGAAAAVPARTSTTIIDATLGDLTASDYAIEVRLDEADPESAVVCGNIGGVLGGAAPGTELALGLVQQNGSNYTGIAWLQDEDEQTVVNLFLAPGLTGGTGASGTTATATTTSTAPTSDAAAATPAAIGATTDTGTDLASVAVGSAVTTSADVNLRAAPSLDAAIIAILGPGVALEVTGAVEDGWVPVVEVSTGRRGYVTDAFIATGAAS